MTCLPIPPLPNDTARAAEAAFGKGNPYLVVGDQLNEMFAGVDWVCLESGHVRLPLCEPLLAIVTIFQFAEDLPDRQAIEAIRVRTDWKYALHLPLVYPDLQSSVLCSFRWRLWQRETCLQTLQLVLTHLTHFSPLLHGGKEQASALELLKSVCTLSRLEFLAGTMNEVLAALAVQQPEWLRTVARPYWYERYSRNYPALHLPNDTDKQEELACSIGADGLYLLERIATMNSPHIAALPEVQNLKQEWAFQFVQNTSQLDWRSQCCAGCTQGAREDRTMRA